MGRKYFFLFLALYVPILLYLSVTTPISPHEAKIFFQNQGVLGFLMRSGYGLRNWLGVSDFFALRLFLLPFILATIYLYYMMSKIYLQRDSDRYLATLIFLMLPGIITGWVLVNVSTIVIPMVLLFVLAYERGAFGVQVGAMGLLFVIHEASIIFTIAIFIYALVNREQRLALLSAFFILLTLGFSSGIAIGGRPAGHFVDIFGLYGILFSPLVFLYFFYTLYRIFLRESKNILWYISFVALVGSLILSIRQRINLTDFAPYVIVAIVLMLDTFNRSYLVRLPQFRKSYKIGFVTVLGSMVLISSVIILHASLFPFLDKPSHHFAYRLYHPYWIANDLKKNKKLCYDTNSPKLSLQLQFYGIKKCKPR